MMADPHEVLGIEPQASPQAIRQRYLELVRAHPPEQHPERFAAIQQAYERLRDPARRLELRLFKPETTESLEALIRERARKVTHRRLPTHILLSLEEPAP